MGAGCDWLAIGWRFPGNPKVVSAFLVSYVEADQTVWPGSPSPPAWRVPHSQVRITGLRAGISYVVQVASEMASGHRSSWASSPAFRTALASDVPEPPLAPDVLGPSSSGKHAKGCDVARLRLPPPRVGCHAPVEATLQYSLMEASGERPEWQDYEVPVTTRDIEVTRLQPNCSYRFRLIAHNAAGSSHPGTGTDPVYVCAPSPVDKSAGARATHEWLLNSAKAAILRIGSSGDVTSKPDSVDEPMSAVSLRMLNSSMLMVLLVPVFFIWCYCKRAKSNHNERQRKTIRQGGRYQKASTIERGLMDADDDDDDDDDDDYNGDNTDRSQQQAIAGAYDQWAKTLAVHVFVPDSSHPVQIEMSTAGIMSASVLVKQLHLVVSEVAGRNPPLHPDELSIVYESATSGVQLHLHPSCALDAVLAATRVVARIRGPQDAACTGFSSTSCVEHTSPLATTSVVAEPGTTHRL